MKIKYLAVVFIVVLSACAGLTSDYRAQSSVMFPLSSKEEVWRACLDVLLERGCTLSETDIDVGLIQAYAIYPDPFAGYDMRFTWTVQVMEGIEGVNLSIHFDRELGYVGGGASDHVEGFLKRVRAKLEE